MTFVAKATDPISRRSMEVYTTEAGLVFYTGNFLENYHGKNGKTYQKYGGFCFETQHFPDATNRSEFPDIILRPGEEYKQLTVFKFLLED